MAGRVLMPGLQGAKLDSELTRFPSRLVTALEHQFLAGGDRQVARALATCVSLKEFHAGQNLIEQGACDDDLMFILTGSVSVLVNRREVTRSTAGNHVGELCLLDATELRSATVRALERTVVGTLSVEHFTRLAENQPDLWRRLALGLSRRLRALNALHKEPRRRPVVFIGSSSEGLKIASSIHRCLKRDAVVPHLWTKGVFECTKLVIEDLLEHLGETDFAVIVLTPDDVIRHRGESKPSPRDNVIFELGLFMGVLSRERTYIVTPKGDDLKLPTDLLGLSILTFEPKPGRSVANCLRRVTKELRRQIEMRGPR
jgi:predicted nucleotide-binding protein